MRSRNVFSLLLILAAVGQLGETGGRRNVEKTPRVRSGTLQANKKKEAEKQQETKERDLQTGGEEQTAPTAAASGTRRIH